MAAGTIASERAGSGDPLLLIHPTGTDRTVWERLRPRLEEHHEVLAVDLPGHGESPPLDVDPTPGALAEAVAAELDRAGWERPHVVGHSLGGWIALELAAAARTRSVIAIAPSGGFTATWERWYFEAHLRTSIWTAGLIAPYAETLSRIGLLKPLQLGMLNRPWGIPDDVLIAAVRSLGNTEAGRLSGIHQAASHVRGLNRIECPALIIWGTRDRLVLPRQASYFEHRISGLELRWFEGIGHAPPLEAPEQTVDAILDFTGRGQERSGTEAERTAPTG